MDLLRASNVVCKGQKSTFFIRDILAAAASESQRQSEVGASAKLGQSNQMDIHEGESIEHLKQFFFINDLSCSCSE